MLARMLVKIALLILWSASLMAAPMVVRVDFGQTNGLIRPLHGINKGPLGAGGLVDLTEQHKSLRVPVARLAAAQAGLSVKVGD